MITQFKIFEFGGESDDTDRNVVYRNKKFQISGLEDGIKNYRDDNSRRYAIHALVRLVAKNSKYLESPKLRKIKVSERDNAKNSELLELTDERLKNIEHYRSSIISDFFNELDKLSASNYMTLVIKYQPVVQQAINWSKNYGGIINKFIKIKEQITKEFNVYIDIEKYNL